MNETIASAAGLLAVELLLAGCGGSHPPARASAPALRAASPCRPAAVAAFARAVGRPASAVHTRAALGNNAAPECRLSAGSAGAVVNIDTSPQPYQRLERTIVEDGQQFGTAREFSAPQTVTGVGLDAAWLPDLNELMTADSRRLVRVTVAWPAVNAGRRRRLAKALAVGTLAA